MKVGDYVRTKHKGIFKIDERCHFNKDFKEFRFKAPCDKENDWTTISEVIKSSPNIIDLIEVGDYVNGDRVVEHAYQPGKLYVENIYVGGKGQTTIENYSYELTSKYCYDKPDFIKSIVTKEQFESMEYKVGE